MTLTSLVDVSMESSTTQEIRLGSQPRITLVIPTFNERENIGELLDQLAQVLPAGETEILFVDDSTDDTPAVIAAKESPLAIRVHHRENGVGGLGGAVVEGIRLARGAWVVVMDADLQHPPSQVVELVAAGEREGADLVVGTRYSAGGNRDGLSNVYRKLVSGGSTLLAKTAFARALHGVSDPMSGFFAVRKAMLNPDDLKPLGYKILLELIVRSRPIRVAEVPYTFQARFAGESKSSIREGLRFLRHLATLRFGATKAKMIVYGIIGLTGVLPNLATMWMLSDVLGVHYLPAAIVANQVAIGWNFVFTDLLLFRSGRQRSLLTRLGQFSLINNADLLVRIPLLALLVGVLHIGYLAGTVITLAAMFAFRFLLIDKVVYVRKPDMTSSAPALETT